MVIVLNRTQGGHAEQRRRPLTALAPFAVFAISPAAVRGLGVGHEQSQSGRGQVF